MLSEMGGGRDHSEMSDLVADITDRSLLQGSIQRKAAFEKGQLVATARDHINYSFGSSPTNKYALGAYFRQTGIGAFDDLSPPLKSEYEKCKLEADDIPTPSMSSYNSEQQGDESDEKGGKDNHDRRSSQGSQLHKTKSSNKYQEPIKHKNYLNIYYFIIKFKSLLMRLIQSRTIFSLNRLHFDLINDKSFSDVLVQKKSSQNKLSYSQKLTRLNQFLWRQFKQLPVMNPSHKFAIAQDLLSFFFITTQIFFLPVQTSFEVQFSVYYMIVLFHSLPKTYFSLEILWAFNKGYYQEGVVVTDRFAVMKHYLESDFFIHIMTTFTLYFNQLPIQNVATLIFLFRIPQLMKIVESIDDHFHLQQRVPVGFQLASLLFQIFLVAHLYGCGFHFVGNNSNPEMNWIIQNQLDENSPIERYICSIYFAIIAMITVGFGDITPVNTYERIYVILMTCFSCGIFAFAINTIGTIVKEKQEFSYELKLNKNAILSYMTDRQVSKSNQNKVIRYLEFSHRNPDDRWSKGREIIQNMSKRVKEEFYQEFFSGVLNSIPLFQGRFSTKFIEEIQTHLQEAVFDPGECLTQHDKISTHLFYIITGEVQQMIPSCSTHVAVLKSGDSFDEESFATQRPCKYEYTCKTLTQIVGLSYEKFAEILGNFTVDYEMFSMVVQEMKLGSGQKVYSRQCISCRSKEHDVITCPICHYEVNYELLIKRHVSSQPQKREKMKRKRQEKKGISREKIRKQLKNLRLKMPKSYEYQEDLHKQSAQVTESLFDLSQFQDCDDAMFILMTPRLVYNPIKDDIEQIMDEEEADLEGVGGGSQYAEDYHENTEESFAALSSLTHQVLGQYEAGKREGRRNGLTIIKNDQEPNSTEQEDLSTQIYYNPQGINNNQIFQQDNTQVVIQVPLQNSSSFLLNRKSKSLILPTNESNHKQEESSIKSDSSLVCAEDKPEQEQYDRLKQKSEPISQQNGLTSTEQSKTTQLTQHPIPNINLEQAIGQTLTNQSTEAHKKQQKLLLLLLQQQKNKKYRLSQKLAKHSMNNFANNFPNQSNKLPALAQLSQKLPTLAQLPQKYNNHMLQYSGLFPLSQINQLNHQQQSQKHHQYSPPQQVMVGHGQQDLNTSSRSANFLGSLKNLNSAVNGVQFAGHPLKSNSRISINLNEPSYHNTSNSYIKDISQKTQRLSDALFGSPGNISLLQALPQQSFQSKSSYKNLNGQQQPQQGTQQQLQQQHQQQQQVAQVQQQQQQLSIGSGTYDVETIQGKTPRISKISGAFHRISQMLDMGKAMKMSNKIPEEYHKTVNLEVTAEEPQTEELSFMADGLDTMKLFQYFFPHNNFDVVLQGIKGKLRPVKGTPNRRNVKWNKMHKNNSKTLGKEPQTQTQYLSTKMKTRG